MSENQLEPARSVIAKIGVEKVCQITGKHISTVYRWMYPKDRGGCGGFIPTAEARGLLDFARENGIDLVAEDFFRPRSPEVPQDADRVEPAPSTRAPSGVVNGAFSPGVAG